MSVLKCKPIFLTTSFGSDNHLNYDYEKNIITKKEDTAYNTVVPAHLYFLSDRHIFEGDKYINISTPFLDSTKRAYTATKDEATYLKENKHSCLKVEATTDRSLNLPLIPSSFIDKFIEKEFTVDAVILDYTYEVFDRIAHYDKRNEKLRYSDTGTECCVLPNMNKIIVKVRPDRTVICSRPHNLTYSKEDLEAAYYAGRKGDMQFDSWFTNNY